MSFFSKLKHGLGFTDDDIDADAQLCDDADNTSDDEKTKQRADLPQTNGVQQIDGDSSGPIFDPAMQQSIFDGVLKLFNDTLPDFLSRSIDREAQRRALYDSLDLSIKQYLESLAGQAEQNCAAKYGRMHAELNAQLESVRAKARDVEAQRTDIQQKQLSADRQKRALADRVHDLEAQLATLEAEREQYDLENKSLINKLKVASYHQEEADRLRAELDKLKASPEGAVAEAETRADALEKQVETLTAENTRLTEATANADERAKIADAMIEDLRAKAANARAETERLNGIIAENARNMADIETLNVQISQIEDVLAKRDAIIKRLRKENAEQAKQIAQLEQEKENAVADDISQYGSSNDIETPVMVDSLRISDNDLSAMEATFESNDWLTAPHEPTPSMRADIDDSDFGYKAPKRKPTPPKNDAQLSLF